MFVGHEFLAFALAVVLSSQTKVTDTQILSFGVLAAVAAFLPDLDIGYAIITYAFAVASGAPIGWDAFWEVANTVHRTVTHSLPVGITAALIAWGSANFVSQMNSAPNTKVTTSDTDSTSTDLIAYIPFMYRERSLILAGVVGGCTVIGFYMTAGMVAGAVAAIFMSVVGFLGVITFHRTTLTSNQIGVATAIGTVTHPFGDIFMAAPPPLFAPITSLIGWQIELTRFTFASHPTLNLLGVLCIEVLIVWLGFGAFAQVIHQSVRGYVDRRAIIAAGYAFTILSVPPPTMVDAHRLGFTIVPFALIIGAWSGITATTRSPEKSTNTSSDVPGSRRAVSILTADRSFRTAITSLSALTIAAVTYTTVVLFVIV
jgi:hypothetical protein